MKNKSVHPTIKTFKFCPACSSPKIKANSPKSIRCAKCGLEFFFNPSGAVGAILTDKKGRILFLRRAKEPSKGKLGIPGGFADHFETAEEALIREIKEETGLEIRKEQLKYLCSTTNSYLYAGVEYASIDIYFTAEIDDSKNIRAADDESSCVEFIAPNEIKNEDLSFDSLRNAVKHYKALKNT